MSTWNVLVRDGKVEASESSLPGSAAPRFPRLFGFERDGLIYLQAGSKATQGVVVEVKPTPDGTLAGHRAVFDVQAVCVAHWLISASR